MAATIVTSVTDVSGTTADYCRSALWPSLPPCTPGLCSDIASRVQGSGLGVCRSSGLRVGRGLNWWAEIFRRLSELRASVQNHWRKG